ATESRLLTCRIVAARGTDEEEVAAWACPLPPREAPRPRGRPSAPLALPHRRARRTPPPHSALLAGSPPARAPRARPTGRGSAERKRSRRCRRAPPRSTDCAARESPRGLRPRGPPRADPTRRPLAAEGAAPAPAPEAVAFLDAAPKPSCRGAPSPAPAGGGLGWGGLETSVIAAPSPPPPPASGRGSPRSLWFCDSLQAGGGALVASGSDSIRPCSPHPPPE